MCRISNVEDEELKEMLNQVETSESKEEKEFVESEKSVDEDRPKIDDQKPEKVRRAVRT